MTGRLALLAVVILIGVVAVVIYVSKSGSPDDRVFTEDDVLNTSFVINPGRTIQLDGSVVWAAEGTFGGETVAAYLFEGEADAMYLVPRTIRTVFNSTETVGNVGLLCTSTESCADMKMELEAIKPG